MQPDPWSHLRSQTAARIALGRAGGSLPTAACLSFAADHADARDAVYSDLDVPSLQEKFGEPLIDLHSRAVNRTVYLQRPDLGRRLNEPSLKSLQRTIGISPDVTIVLADGLSAMAAQRHGPDLVDQLTSRLKHKQLSIGPLCVVRQARVAIADEIGQLLKSRLSLILIGERPGLGLADSLGAYLTYLPLIGKTDADRNCVSNIHPNHLPVSAAVDTLVWLIETALVKQLSGVQLKDERIVSTVQGIGPSREPLQIL